MLNHRVLRYFYLSIAISLACIALVYSLTGSLWLVYSALVLSILEISLSFDNAVINAKILNHMSRLWQKRFLLWGILIAVFGMRFVFPIALVTFTTHMGLMQVFHLALYDPVKYGVLLTAGYPLISSFGAGFLLGVFFEFLVSANTRVPWVKMIEQNRLILWLKRYVYSAPILAFILGAPFVYALHSPGCWLAFLLGVGGQYLLVLLNHFFSGKLGSKDMMQYGFIGFMYLEVLDASFSFDGVIGAFAITTNILIIMVGLGIGALFVRSITLYFVEQHVLQRFIYLEHGAHYAIFFLALCLLAKNFTHLPESLVAGVSIVLIALAWGHSLLHAKKQH